DQDAARHLPLADRLSDGESVVGVIDALVTGRTHVQDLVAQAMQQADEAALGLEAAMVAADGNFHGSTWLGANPDGTITAARAAAPPALPGSCGRTRGRPPARLQWGRGCPPAITAGGPGRPGRPGPAGGRAS